MKGGEKYKNLGGLGGYESPKIISNITVRYNTYDFLFDFDRHYAFILYRFRDIASYLSKVANFNPLHRHLSSA